MRTWNDLKDRVKNLIDPLSFYQHEGQEVKAIGQREWKIAGLCPFHADRNVGSFYINVRNGAFKCYSCNSTGGDIIAFTEMKYELSFKKTLQKLANDWRLS